MAVLPDAWLGVINDVLDSPTAWRSPAKIAEALGLGVEETADRLCDLDLAGWLTVWESESGPLVTLSPLAAQRLDVRLVEVGPSATPRWARAGEPDPPSIRSKNVCLSERAASLEFLRDPGMLPDQAAERGERAEIRALSLQKKALLPRTLTREELPRPTVLVGLSLTPWPGPNLETGSICPACGGGPLGPQMYCLYCDRWGFDPADLTGIETRSLVLNADSPRPRPRGADTPAFEQAQAERLRARRKAKRQLRHGTRFEADRLRKQKPVSQQSSNESLPRLIPLSSPPKGHSRSHS